MTEPQTRFRIYEYITKTRWMHVEDALEIAKIRLYAGEYKRGEGAKSTAHHFIDMADARVLFFDLSLGRITNNHQDTYTEYKGGVNGNGEITSRVLKIKKAKDGRVWIELRSGPGTHTDTGAIKPAGEPFTSVSVGIDVYNARRLGATVTAYLTVRETSHWRDEWRKQLQKETPA